jgi:hypothetical protein
MGTLKMKTVQGYAILAALAIPNAKVEPEVAHHILVVDRSGSMYYDIAKLKQSIEQAIAVESYGNPEVLTTLISFSSQGDLTLHWSRISVEEVMKLDNPYIGEIRDIQATFLTGMSQALELAIQMVKGDETTGITMFTDGYANDPSPSHENKALANFVEEGRKHSRLFFNAVGYRNWCDWPRLNAMTNALSGKTVQARSFKDVLEVMKDTQELLASGCRPVVELTAPDADYIMAVVGDKVLASIGTLKLAGLSEDDEVLAWGITDTEKPSRGVKSVPRGQEWLYGALAYANLSLGNLREAKEALFQSGNKTAYEAHKTALAPSAIADMLTDLQAWVAQQDNTGFAMGRNVKPKYNMDHLVRALCQLPRNSASLNLDLFWKTYTRRSVKKLLGTRNEDGSITPPKATSEGYGPCYIRGAEWSTTEATLNIGTVRKLAILDANGEKLTEVAHIDLGDMAEFRDYTLLGSGEMVVAELPVVIFNKAAWVILQPYLPNIKANKTFTAGKTYVIRLKDFSLVSEEAPSIESIIRLLASMKDVWAEQKLFNAMKSKEVHTTYTPEQLAALDGYHITGGLYFSPPMTTPYTDKMAAIKAGQIDQYTRYKVMVGDKDVLHSGKYHSGNKALGRFFVVNVGGEKQKSPKLPQYWDDTFEVVSKPRSKRAKYTAMDDIMERVYTDMLVTKGAQFSETDFNAQLAHCAEMVDGFNDIVRPLVIELGCTGMMPEGLGAEYEQLDADELVAKYECKLTKAEKEGTFFVFDNGNLIISVFPSVGEYSTGN